MGIVGVVFAGSFAAFVSWRLALRWKQPHDAGPEGPLDDDGADKHCRLSITGKQELEDISTELGLKCIASDERCSAQDSTTCGQSTRDSSRAVAATPECDLDLDLQIAGEEGSLNCSLPAVQVAGSLGVVAGYDDSVLAGSSRPGWPLGHMQVCRDGGGDSGDTLQACMVELQDPELDGAPAQSGESAALAEESGKPKFSFNWCTREEHMEQELEQRTLGRSIPAEGSRGSTATQCARKDPGRFIPPEGSRGSTATRCASKDPAEQALRETLPMQRSPRAVSRGPRFLWCTREEQMEDDVLEERTPVRRTTSGPELKRRTQEDHLQEVLDERSPVDLHGKQQDVGSLI